MSKHPHPARHVGNEHTGNTQAEKENASTTDQHTIEAQHARDELAGPQILPLPTHDMPSNRTECIMADMFAWPFQVMSLMLGPWRSLIPFYSWLQPLLPEQEPYKDSDAKR